MPNQAEVALKAVSGAGDRVTFRTPARMVVLVSGSGTLLQALLDAADPNLGIVAVGADRAGIEGLARAERAGIGSFVVRLADHPDRVAWDGALTEAVAAHRPDLVVSAGFMKLVGREFLARFGGRMINTHPALLPSFPGAGAVADALAAGVSVTGATVHLVDAGMDTGPIIAQRPVDVLTGDDVLSLHERIKTVERELLVEVLGRIARDGVTVEGREVGTL
jgi:phosphoribosylglycinamide formyltransferase-1